MTTTKRMILHEIMLSISKTNILNIFITSKTNYLNFFRGYLVKIFYFYYLKQGSPNFLDRGPHNISESSTGVSYNT